MTSTADNALAALERARQAQETHDKRIDVQLRLRMLEASGDKLTADGTITDSLGNFVGIDQPLAAATKGPSKNGS